MNWAFFGKWPAHFSRSSRSAWAENPFSVWNLALTDISSPAVSYTHLVEEHLARDLDRSIVGFDVANDDGETGKRKRRQKRGHITDRIQLEDEVAVKYDKKYPDQTEDAARDKAAGDRFI